MSVCSLHKAIMTSEDFTNHLITTILMILFIVLVLLLNFQTLKMNATEN